MYRFDPICITFKDILICDHYMNNYNKNTTNYKKNRFKLTCCRSLCYLLTGGI